MPPKPSPHSLHGRTRSLKRRSWSTKFSQYQYRNAQGPAEMDSNVSRMPDDRIPKQLLYGELCRGKCTIGGQWNDPGQLEGLAERLFKHQYRVFGVTPLRKTLCRKLETKQTNGCLLNVRHGSHSLLSRHSLWAQKMSAEEAMGCTVDFFCFCHTSLSGHLFCGRMFEDMIQFW